MILVDNRLYYDYDTMQSIVLASGRPGARTVFDAAFSSEAITQLMQLSEPSLNSAVEQS